MSNAGSDERQRDVVGRLQGEVAELRRSRRRLAEAADDDRRGMERALHDGIQQYLVAVAVDLRRLSGLLERDPAAAKALLDEVAANVSEALAEAADLAQRIYPLLLGSGGLGIALRSAAEAAGVTLVADIASNGGYPAECASAVYRACERVLSSASPGSEATITVREADGALTFEIAIAGRPSDDRVERLRDGIEAFEGHVAVERIEPGTRVYGSLPLPRSP